MGLLVAIFAHAMLFVILLGIFGVLSALIWRVLRVRNRAGRLILILAPFGLAALPFTLFVASIVWANVAPASHLFERVFDREAGDEVSDLKGSSEAVNDAKHIFLAFRAAPGILPLLVKGLNPVSSGRAAGKVPLPVAPDAVPAWWAAARCRDRSVVGGENIRQWDEIVVTQCRSDGRLYVEAVWIE